MDDKKLDLICDLNLYVADSLDRKYELFDANNSSFFVKEMLNSLNIIGHTKVSKLDKEKLMMVATLLDATANILKELDTKETLN